METIGATRTVLDLLASQHEERGSAPAILAPGREAVSYAELRLGVDRAGAVLGAIGLGRGNRVAVALPDGSDAALAMLAALAWSTCAPLNPRLDFAEYAALFRQLRIDALITAEGDDGPVFTAALAEGLSIARLSAAERGSADLFALRAETRRTPVERTRPRPDDVALLMHTSGTTSKPKVVPIMHRSLILPVGPGPVGCSDRFLCLWPLHTAVGLQAGVISPLVRGASTVITPGFDAARFFEWLDAFQPTYFSASPTVHAAIVDELRRHRPRLPASLRFVRSSTGAMSAPLQEEVESALGVPVVQSYGSTEAGLVAQDSPPPGRRRAGSVGVARGTEIMVMGENCESLPPGNVGEILVRGPGVMPGYESDPEANRLAFHAGWLRTGDLGYLDADGYLFITGRLNELINRGGRKVAPAEIDAIFMRHPMVRDAATVGMSHPSLGEDVVTAVILRSGASTTAQQLRQFALEHMAAFKVPSTVLLVDAFPRNALGKVQRRALADSLKDRTRADFVQPRDREEDLIAEIFATVLGVQRIGSLDNFFDLGGDSLRAFQVLSRVRAQTGLEMAPEELFVAPTVEQFAQRLRAAGDRRANSVRAPPLGRGTSRDAGG